MRVVWICQHVGDMSDTAVQYGPPGRYGAVWSFRIGLQDAIQNLRWKVVACWIVEKVTVVFANDTERLSAKARGALNNSLEHWIRIHRRPANNVQHLTRSSLELKRFLQLPRPCLHLLEQAHIVDRDHRLVGEGRHQLDLLIGEGLRRRSRHCHDPDAVSFLQQRYAQHCAE